MSCSVQAEAHQAENADDDTVNLIQAPSLSQQSVRRLVKSDQHPMHQMAGAQYQKHRNPEGIKVQRSSQDGLVKKENGGQDWEGRAADPMRFSWFQQNICRWRCIHRVRVIREAIRLCGERQASSSTTRKMYDKFS